MYISPKRNLPRPYESGEGEIFIARRFVFVLVETLEWLGLPQLHSLSLKLFVVKTSYRLIPLFIYYKGQSWYIKAISSRI